MDTRGFMSSTENVSFVKITNYKMFGVILFTKEEIYTENSSEGEPFKIIVNQDYFNKEFDIGKNKSNDKKA